MRHLGVCYDSYGSAWPCFQFIFTEKKYSQLWQIHTPSSIISISLLCKCRVLIFNAPANVHQFNDRTRLLFNLSSYKLTIPSNACSSMFSILFRIKLTSSVLKRLENALLGIVRISLSSRLNKFNLLAPTKRSACNH